MYEKKGYHTPEAEAAREKETERRRQQSEANYRKKFEGLDLDFTFLRREWSRPKDRRFWVKCNRCGAEFLHSEDILRGQIKTMRCKYCGNGTGKGSELANEALAYYAEGHSSQETADKFGIKKTQVDTWARARGIKNGRTLSEIQTEKARKGAELKIKAAGERLAAFLHTEGLELVGEYRGHNSRVSLKCLTCGAVFERTANSARKKAPKCPGCEETRRKETRRLKEAQAQAKKAEREAIKAEKAAANPLGLSAYQLEREKKLDEVHFCKICGREYTVREYVQSIGGSTYSNPGYCSKECKAKNANKKEREHRKQVGVNHYRRAKKLGLPIEKGVTLPKLFKRDGGVCQICGLACLYYGDHCADLYPSIDHIIPLGNDPEKKGGHTWKNVQLAHRVCNSIKSAKVGKEWNNGND